MIEAVVILTFLAVVAAGFFGPDLLDWYRWRRNPRRKLGITPSSWYEAYTCILDLPKGEPDRAWLYEHWHLADNPAGFDDRWCHEHARLDCPYTEHTPNPTPSTTPTDDQVADVYRALAAIPPGELRAMLRDTCHVEYEAQ